MHRPHSLAPFTFALAILAALAAPARPANILDLVPHDALGFAVIKNLNATDTKVADLLKTLNAEYPSPLIFLEAVTGIREGLDVQGDFLLAVLPSNDNPNASPQYCVWLPVTDYDRLLNLLEATAGDPISAIRVADEDLLIARQGDWAVLMDPDQRPRLEQMLTSAPNPPATIAAWKGWIDNNDAAVVLLRPGIQQVLAWSAKPPKPNKPNAEESDDDLFGLDQEPAEFDPFVNLEDDPLPNPLYDPIRVAVHKWIVRSAKVSDLVEKAEAIGCAARIDDAGNALSSLRLRSSIDQPWNAAPNVDASLTPTLFDKGDFIVNGAGRLPPALMAIAAAAHSQRMIDELKTTERVELDDELVGKFRDAFVIAASDVTAWSVLHRPGDLKTGVHNNNFLVVRAPSAKIFMEHVADSMERWNDMHRESESDTSYVFDVEETKFGDRQAVQYVLDLSASRDMVGIPEMRQLMERFFGPGGKMHWWVVPVDEQTVLLAAATREQTIAALETLDRREPIDWNKPELAAATKLLADKTDWRFFFSPRGYYQWKRVETEAMNNGIPVIGGRPAKEFPPSPAVAFSGSSQDNELEVSAAVPADTIKSAGKFFKK